MTKSTGILARIPEGKNFGFIKINNQEYFFHRDDFNGNWEALVSQYNQRIKINVQCNIVESVKGPRVSGVTVL